jgi:hypothetical protein
LHPERRRACAKEISGTDGAFRELFNRDYFMKRFLICLLAALAAAPALAQAVTVDEYLVVRDPDPHKCTIVEHRPAVATSIVNIGIFKTRTVAEASIKTMEDCKSDLDDD